MVFTAAKEEGGEGGQGPRNPDAAEDDTILQDKGILQVIHNSHLRWGLAQLGLPYVWVCVQVYPGMGVVALLLLFHACASASFRY